MLEPPSPKDQVKEYGEVPPVAVAVKVVVVPLTGCAGETVKVAERGCGGVIMTECVDVAVWATASVAVSVTL